MKNCLPSNCVCVCVCFITYFSFTKRKWKRAALIAALKAARKAPKMGARSAPSQKGEGLGAFIRLKRKAKPATRARLQDGLIWKSAIIKKDRVEQ